MSSCPAPFALLTSLAAIAGCGAFENPPTLASRHARPAPAASARPAVPRPPETFSAPRVPDPEEIADAKRAAQDEVRKCGREAGFVGPVTLGATLAQRGHVIAMEIDGPGAGFEATPTGACVQRALRDVRVKWFSGEPIELRFDATILPRLARPPRPPFARRDPALIQRVVRERFGEFRGCYEDGLRRDILLAGRVSVRFAIGADGEVSEAESTDPELPDVRARQCVRRVFEGLVFPPGDGTVTVTYPLMFSPGG